MKRGREGKEREKAGLLASWSGSEVVWRVDFELWPLAPQSSYVRD